MYNKIRICISKSIIIAYCGNCHEKCAFDVENREFLKCPVLSLRELLLLTTMQLDVLEKKMVVNSKEFINNWLGIHLINVNKSSSEVVKEQKMERASNVLTSLLWCM
jgi:hypothetical protein